MDQAFFFSKLEELIEDARTALLVTIGPDNKPHVRWMTPAVIKSRPGVIFTISAADAPKIEHINKNGNVEWMFQTVDLSEIVNIKGIARVLENPALKAELMEQMAAMLEAFWKSNFGSSDFIIIETVMQSGTYFQPLKGTTENINFDNNFGHKT